VHNGISTKIFRFNKKGSEIMLFSGRLKKIKGLMDAIDVSLKAGKKMKFVGSVSMDESDRNYLNNNVMPKINRNKRLIKYRGFIPRDKIGNFYGCSKLTLFPIKWEEPFGLVMIESMATGTPVVGFARGSVKEVIKDGETGFIINPSDDDIRGNWIIKKTGIEGMVEAVKRIYSMPEEEYSDMRRNCRKHVEENFSIEHMVDEYEKAYKKILSKKR
jgi:glycosyltransferase involved in cell wall biosynthesis